MSGTQKLSLKSLRILHRSLEDTGTLIRIKSLEFPAPELERLLRNAGTDPEEIQHVLDDYKRLRG